MIEPFNTSFDTNFPTGIADKPYFLGSLKKANPFINFDSIQNLDPLDPRKFLSNLIV